MEPNRKGAQVVKKNWFLTGSKRLRQFVPRKVFIARTCDLHAITSWSFNANHEPLILAFEIP